MESLILLTALVGVDLAITDTASPRLAITESSIGVNRGEITTKAPLVGYYFNASWCPNCKGSDAVMQELIAAGLDVEIVDVDERSDLATLYGVDAVPKFVRFDGSEYRWAKGAMSRDRIAEFYATPLPGAKPAGVVATSQAASVGFSQPAPQVVTRPSIPPARRTWSYRGSDLAAHVRNTHGIDTSGMSYSDLVKAHSHAHEGTWSNSYRGGYIRSQPVRQYAARTVYRSGCPGGRCP